MIKFSKQLATKFVARRVFRGVGSLTVINVDSLKAILFLAILLGAFFVIYRQSDHKKVGRWGISFKTAIIFAASAVGLMPLNTEAIQPPENNRGSRSQERVLSTNLILASSDSSSNQEQSEDAKKNQSSEQDKKGIQVVDKIPDNPALAREAKRAERDPKTQKALDNLVDQLSAGNPDSAENLFTDIYQLRGDNRAWVYYREVDGKIELLGKSGKDNRNRVRGLLRKTYFVIATNLAAIATFENERRKERQRQGI